MNEFTMPYEQEKKLDEKGSSRDIRLYKPLPDKAGLIVNNDVIIPLFSPHDWSLFNPTPEDAAKYGMVGSGLVSMNPSDPIFTFYFRLPVHNIQNFNHPDGSVKRFAQIVCPVALNRYLIESLGRGPLFDQPRCAFCEEEQRHWDAFNARWDSCGTDKRSLSKEGYWKFIDNDAVLSAEREAARKFGVDTRFVISVFDHAKFSGVRPLDEGQEGVQHQIWFAPKSIYQKLLQLYEAGGPGGFRFFEPTAEGFPVLFVVKNTSECKAGDLRNTKYDVGFVNRYHPYPPEWIAYLQNSQAMVDPSDFVHLLNYEEARYYVASQQTSAAEYNAPAQQPAGAPPGMQQPFSAPAGAPPAAGAPQGFAPPAGAPPAGAPQGFTPPAGGPPPSAPAGSVSPDGYTAPAGVVPPAAPPAGAPPAGAPPAPQQPVGAPPVGAPPAGAPPAGTPAGAPPAAPGGAPIPIQPPAAAAPTTATPGGPVPVVPPIQTQGAPAPGGPPPGAPPAAQPYPGAPGAPPAGAPPVGAPPAAQPYPGAPGAPPAAAPPAGAPPAAVPPSAPPAGAPPAGAPPAGAPLAAPGAPPATTAPAQGQPPDRTPPAGEDPPGRRRSW